MMRPASPLLAIAFALMLPGLAGAADMPAARPMPDTFDQPARDHGPDADGRGLGAWRRREAAGGRYAEECPDGLWRPPYGLIVPTNAPCDLTYVGSSFGLNQPSVYGTLPPPGVGAP